MENILEAVGLKKRSDIHWARKIWHMAGVSLIAYVYSVLPEAWSLALLAALWLIAVPCDLARLRWPALNDFVLHVMGPIMRQSEVDKIAGTTYLITGVTVVAIVFPRDIVLLTLLFLAFADPIASYFGIRFGKDKILGQKSLQGTLAAFFVCAVLSFAFLSYHDLLMDRLVVVSLIGGVIGALAELIPIWKLDDNLTLPLVSATALYFLFTLFGAFATYA
jgi:dolichol kinase